jgi:UDP-glucose 4-epimerase
MTILITGGAGYIGSHMAYALRDAGEQVLVLDNLSTGCEWAVPEGVRLVVGDAGDQSAVDALLKHHRIEVIIHFSGSIIVSESMRRPLEYYRNNTVNSWALIQTAVRHRVPYFIFSSSAAVYGNPEMIPIPEEAPTNPVSPYGASKLMTEVMLRDAAAAHGLSYVILRYFNVAGADPQLRTGQSSKQPTHLIKVAVQAALGIRRQVEVYGNDYATPDGTCIRDYIHVADLVDAHHAALRYLRDGGRSVTLNCGYGHGFSVLEVLDTVRRVAGADFTVQHAARRLGDPARLVADAGRIKSLFGWQPQWDDLPSIVRHALSWERKLLAMNRL